MISLSRLINDFMILSSFDSESFSERSTADWLSKELTRLGFTVEEDNAGSFYGGNAGNLYGFLKGTLPGEPLLLSAHMDVVPPGKNKKAILGQNGTIVSDHSTVLGADDICGIIEILEGIRHAKEANLPMRDIEVLFSIGEELHARGASCFDYSKIRARQAYIPDLSGPVGSAAIAAPSLITFQITFNGKAAHAGFAPESGINAIQAMANLIQKLPLGRPDPFSTMNVGIIQGGLATNIVPDSCACFGEIRSTTHERALSHISHLKELILETERCTGVQSVFKDEVVLTAYHTDQNSPVVRRFLSACKKMGFPGKLTETFGGSDNNHFSLHGIQGIVLSCGMYNVHTVDEYTRTIDLILGANLFSLLISSPI